MAVAFELEPIKAGSNHPLRRIGIVLDDTLYVPVLHLLRKGAMGRFPDARRRNHRQPVGLGPDGAATEMRQLDHDRGAVLMTFIGELLQPRDDLVLVGEKIAEGGRRVRRYDRRSRGHGERDTTLRTLDVIEPIAVLR